MRKRIAWNNKNAIDNGARSLYNTKMNLKTHFKMEI